MGTPQERALGAVGRQQPPQVSAPTLREKNL